MTIGTSYHSEWNSQNAKSTSVPTACAVPTTASVVVQGVLGTMKKMMKNAMMIALAMAIPVLCGSGEAEWSARYVTVEATAYCCCTICTTGSGISKTGTDARRHRGCAVSPDVIALGSRLDIPGYGTWIKADDTGSAIKGRRIDLRFIGPKAHEEAKQWGRKKITVRVWTRKEGK